MKKQFVIAALATAMLASPAWADHHETIVGNWDTVTETPMGNMASGISVGQSEEGYTVAIEDRMEGMPAMESTISDIAVDGATVTFVRALETPQGPMELTYRLTADGDALAGEANSSFGAVPITGTRAAAEAAAE